MEKRIFAEQLPPEAVPHHQLKREFVNVEVIDDEPLEQVEEPPFEPLKPARRWVRLLLGALVLFVLAAVAQTLHWLIDSAQNGQWIAFVAALACLLASFAGVGVIINEWAKLRWLRKYQHDQQVSYDLWQDNSAASGQKAQEFCKNTLRRLPPSALTAQAEKRWLSQLDDAYNGQEVLYLFSENVLEPIDRQVKKLIRKAAVESAALVALSPLAVADILMVAWRNFALVNQISRAYGIEMGYFSRLKLFKLVLTNMVFAGATELALEAGTELVSQNLTAKLSARAAQGIGVGLLTARLGLKAMEFCRPVAFQAENRPKLAEIRQTLLGSLKQTIFNQTEAKEAVR